MIIKQVKMSAHSKQENKEVNYQLCVHNDCPKFWNPLIGYLSECKYPKIVKLPGLYTYLFVMSLFIFDCYSYLFQQDC